MQMRKDVTGRNQEKYILAMYDIRGKQEYIYKSNKIKEIIGGFLHKLASEFLLAYILPMIAFDFGDMNELILFLIYFSVLVFLCIRNNNMKNVW